MGFFSGFTGGEVFNESFPTGGTSGIGTVSSDVATPGTPNDSNWSRVVDDLIKVGGTLGGLVLTQNQKNSQPPVVWGGGTVAAQQPPRSKTDLTTVLLVGIAALGGALAFSIFARR